MQVFTQFDKKLITLWESALSKEPIRWPFLTPSWHQAWQQHLAGSDTLVILGDEAKRVVLPLARTGDAVHFTGGEETADYLDAIGPEADKGALWQEAVSILKTNGATSLTLRNIPKTSESLTFFRTLPSASVEQEDATPILTLSKSFEEYLAVLGRKERHEMRRKLRRFDEVYPGSTFRVEVHPDIELLIGLMRKNHDKQEFLTPEMVNFFRALPAVLGEALQQFTLIRNDTPVASTIAFVVNQSLLLYNSGYDPSAEGSGWYLKSKLIDWAMRQKYTEINFLQGKERYKYDLGAKDFLVYRVTLSL